MIFPPEEIFLIGGELKATILLSFFFSGEWIKGEIICLFLREVPAAERYFLTPTQRFISSALWSIREIPFVTFLP